MRLLCWSGPRNLSTALMYAFGNRADFAAMDEPFYAAYLAATGLDHPMRDRVLAAQATDPGAVARRCAAEPAQGNVYQKHMTHHMLPHFPRDFLKGAVNVFLIRHPARVLASYAEKREGPTLADIGAVEQLDLFQYCQELGPVAVIDSADIRAAPDGTLSALCAAIGLPFDPAMLAWPAGPKPFDGAWAPHWYGAVHRSTGFAGPEGPLPELPPPLADLAEAALPAYTILRERALTR